MPLSTYENIIPQHGEIVKRLAAVFKKISGVFLLGRRAFFYAEFRVGYQRGTKVLLYIIVVYTYVRSRVIRISYYIEI